jgi:hypothetical protein
MKHSDFQIGTVFLSPGGHWCRCTDVGQRTILAIVLNREPPLDPVWFEGPPYLTGEIVFDERDITDCWQTAEDAIRSTIKGVRTGEVGYRPLDEAFVDLEARAEQFTDQAIAHKHMEVIWRAEREARLDPSRRYPFPRVLAIERIAPDGDILHPYAADRDSNGTLEVAQ